jgi:DNA-binding transcriptional LysR family regulator
VEQARNEHHNHGGPSSVGTSACRNAVKRHGRIIRQMQLGRREVLAQMRDRRGAGDRDVLAAGCDAGIRYDERLEQDMIAVPIGPRVQRFAAAAAPAYLDRRGRPEHPRQLLDHACLRGRFSSGAMLPWDFESGGEVVRVDPAGPLLVGIGGATDLAVDAAIAGTGIVYLFEDWLRPHLDSGALEPVLEPWWPRFSGPFLYYPGQRLVPATLRAFVNFIKTVATDMGWNAPFRTSPR